MQILRDGEFIEVDGKPAVRFVRRYDHPVEKVWRAVTEPDQLKHWFPSPDVSYEPRVGGAITMTGDPYAPAGSTGKVLAWDPPHRFGFDWEKDQLFFTVTADGDGAQLELINLLSERGGAARNGAGWDFCLGDLADALDGTPRKSREEHRAEQTPEEEMQRFLPILEDYKKLGLPDDGWLPEPA